MRFDSKCLTLPVESMDQIISLAVKTLVWEVFLVAVQFYNNW